MRAIPLAALLATLAAPAFSQDGAPLQPYVPPPSAAPLAPLPSAAPAVDQPLGKVRLKSDTASNNSAADTTSPIAPMLPTPSVAADSAAAFLAAARTAILAGNSGEAQEALERAESRLLSRDVAPSEAGTASADPAIHQVGVARQALSAGDREGALAAIAAALAAG